jgi:hypothetical protein
MSLPAAGDEVDGAVEVVVRSGEVTTVPLTIVHEGTGAPWPDGRQLVGPVKEARVRVQARPVDGAVGGVDEGASATDAGGPVAGAELPTWMLPGDRATTEFGILGTDADGDPLAPGRYRIRLGVTQDGEQWFTERSEPVELVVRVTD